MLKLIIEDDEGRKTVVPFVRDELTIGRQEGNTIRLTERNVSRRHARLLRRQEQVLVEDLGSANGIRLNGERVEGQVPVRHGDLIQIGDYDLALQLEAAVAAPPAGGTPALQEGEGEASAARGAGDPRHQATAIIRRDQVETVRVRRVEALDPAQAPRLVVLGGGSGDLEGREFSLVRTEMRIGRTEDNDIAIDHRSLSRTHARLLREDDGTWKVVDLQSANGVTVNGERYAQAPLADGDLLELGHVRLRFTRAGAPRARASARPRALLSGLALAALLGAGAYAGLARLRSAPAAAVAPPAGEQGLEAARTAMSERQFEQAVAQLAVLRGPDGAPLPAAQGLLERARTELAVKGHLLAAQQALESGDVAAAQALLAKAAGTEAYAGELAVLSAQASAAATPAPAPPTPAAAAPRAAPAKRAPRPAAGAGGTAQALYADGFRLFKKQQFEEAEVFFRKCIGEDAAFASCHMMLGTTYANLKQLEKGALHYRRFLELAPTHPKAAAVRRHLEAYEKARSEAQ